MKRSALLVALWCACGGEEAEPTPPPPPSLRWVRTQAPNWDLEIHVPSHWAEGYRVLGDGHEIHFGGPLDDGWRPELAFGWMASRKTAQEWAAGKIRTFEDSPLSEVHERGRCTVAGMPGEFCVYGYEVKLAAGPTQMRAMGFFFGGHGFIGFVRGVVTARTFRDTYRRVFEEAARRVRYRPQ
ncbi:MAG: hypothetical protein ACYTEZ_12830 [Planctomycetota bacterium]|jgi:hypothetical protein